jgi:uncharacterized UBP type Zn finger protein
MLRRSRRRDAHAAVVPETCEHLAAEIVEPQPQASGECQGCAELGENTWAHLRMCLTCGRVGCCDSSPHRHALEHFHQTGHPVMRSAEPGEKWRWCYIDVRLG